MPIPPPPPGFTLDTPGVAPPLPPGRPVIRKGVTPPTPDLPQGYGMTGDTAVPVKGLPSAVTTPESYRPITPQERESFGVDPHKPFVVNVKTGKPELISQGKEDESSTPANDPDRVFQSDQLLKSIGRIRELVQQPLSHGTGTDYLKHVPIIGQNASDLDSALTQIKGDILRNVLAQAKQASPNGASGFGNLSNVEGEALKSSIAKLQQSQSTKELVEGLDQAEQFYKRSLARSMGLDPMDPATAKRLNITLPEGAAKPNEAPELGRDNGITASSPMPIVDANDATLQTSTETKAVIDPKKRALGEKIAGLVSQGADRNTIMGFAVGADPTLRKDPKFGAWVDQAIKYREKALKEGHKSVKFGIDPGFYTTTVPLSDEGLISEKDMAKWSADPNRAGVAASADTATFGAMPDIVGAASALTGGDFSKARGDFKDRQNLLAYENPKATVAGDLVGALTTGLAGAPKSFPGLVASAGKQGGVYGFLSSDDPSLTGRLESGVRSGATSAVGAAVLDPALRGVGTVGRKAGNSVQRFLGTPAEDIANADAMHSFATHAPNQDVPAMKGRAAAQESLGVDPTGLDALDRSGQDYLGRQVARSPEARQAADEAVTAAQGKIPAQIEGDFNQAIDAAAGDKNVATFLKRPAREITHDIQEMAGREYEAGIEPIKNERLNVDPNLTQALSHEQATAAIGDALRNHKLSPETRAILRSLPQWIKEGVDLSKFPVTVDALKNVATALDRRGAKLQAGSEGGMTLGDLSAQIRDHITEQFPEYKPVNDLYASRKRAIGALEDARRTFLGDSTGDKTDTLAKATARMSAEPGAPEFKGAPEETGGFSPTKPPQAMPSEKQMAMAGAKEATVANAANRGEPRLSTPGQKERNRMILGERADALEARSGARDKSIKALERIQSAAAADDTGGKVAALIKAAANLLFHRGGAAAASGMSGARGLKTDDAARVVKLLTAPGNASDVIASLEKAYGRRKARFIIDRIGAMTLTASKNRKLPDEATKSGNDQ